MNSLLELLGVDVTAGEAVVDGGVTLERGELFDRARRRAAAIRDAVPPDCRVAFVDTEDHEAVTTIVAALLAERPLAMVPVKADRETSNQANTQARCAVVATGSELVPVEGPLNDDPRSLPSFGAAAADSPEALVLYTSGTTSEPRGVRLSRRNVLSNLTAMLRTTHDWTPTDRFGLVLALTHSFGLSMTLLALARRTPTVLIGGAPPGHATAALVESAEVSVFAAVPYYLRLLARRGLPLGSAFAPQLNTVFLAGGGISDAELDAVAPELSAETYLMYGFTEATARVAVRRRGDGAPTGSVGLPLPGTHVEIVDGSGHVLPVGSEGRIRVSSPSLLIGFLGEEPRSPSAPIVTTDLGRVDEAGNLFITGREAEMVNFRGNRVSLVAQEARTLAIQGVREARLVPATRDEDAQCALHLVVAEGTDLRAIKRSALGLIEPRGLVRDVVFVDHLETTRSGKPIRRTASDASH